MPTWEDVSPYTDRATRAPWLTGTNVLLGLNIAGFVATGLLQKSIDLSPVFFDARAAIGQLHLWQFLTHSFVQFVDFWFLFWFVLIGYICYLFGNELETEIGTPRAVLNYLAFAAYGALMHAAYQYLTGSEIPACSFLGPVCGIFVTSGLRTPHRVILFFLVIPMRMITAVILGGLVIILYCIAAPGVLSPFAALGAGLSAWAIHALEPRLDAALARLSRRSAALRNHGEQDVRREVDEILEKISRQGIGSLTRAERKALRRGSEFLNRPPMEAPRWNDAPPALKTACLLAPLAAATLAFHAWGDDLNAVAAKTLAETKYESINHGAFRVFIRKGSPYHLFAAQTLQGFTDEMCRAYGGSLSLRPPDIETSRITVCLLDDPRDFESFGMSDAMADPARKGAYFNPALLGIAIEVDPTAKRMDTDRRTLQHVMTHVLLHLAAPRAEWSPWLEEGLAGVFEDGPSSASAAPKGRPRTLTAFLMSSEKHRPGFLEYCKEEAKDGPVDPDAFRRTIGNPAEVDAACQEWIFSLEQP